MRRWPTWVLAGALVALAAVAAADALRPGRSSVRRESFSRPTAGTTVGELKLREPRGVLYFSAPQDDCRLHAVELPRLASAPPPKLRSCKFSLSADGSAAVPGDAVWSPGGKLYAREAAGTIELGSPSSRGPLRLPGRAPAFMPDGTFTYVRGEAEVVRWIGDCPPRTRIFTLPGDNATARCRLPLVAERDLRRLLPDDPGDPVAINDLAWLEAGRLAIVVELDRGTSEVTAIIEPSGRATVAQRYPGTGHRIEASPQGAFYALWRGTTLLGVGDARGEAIVLPPVGSVRAVAWSPDDRWAAVATEFSVFVFRASEADAVRRLPILARDLAWR